MFVCQTCSKGNFNATEMTLDEIKCHLLEGHKSDGRGYRQMVSHIDFAAGYSTTYQWTFGEVTIMEYVTEKHEKGSLMDAMKSEEEP